MAFLTKNVFGQISGKIGNAVVRNRYGKEVVYSKPLYTNISFTDKAVAGRNKFANTVKLARLINSNPELSSIWRSAKIKGTNSYQRIIKYNAPFTIPEGFTIKNLISPQGLDPIYATITLDENLITVAIDIEPNIELHHADSFLLIAPDRVNNFDPFIIFSSNSSLEGNSITSRFILEEKQIDILENHTNLIALVTFSFKDIQANIIGWTSTIPFLIKESGSD